MHHWAVSDGPHDASEQRTLDAIAAALDELKQHATRQTDRVFAQLEALIWLRDMLQLERPLPPTRGWAASPDLLLHVANRIADTRPKVIVEMGSGTSSVVLGACLRRFGPGTVVSLEHEPQHAERMRAEIARHDLSDIVTVVDAPLGDMEIDGAPWRWYTVPMEAIPERIDMLFVDGPPAATWPLARYPALPVFRERLSENAAIYLDDGVRTDERDIAARWAREDPTFTAEPLKGEKEPWLLYR